MQKVTPFLLLKQSVAQALRDATVVALTSWSARWSALPSYEISCIDASDKAAAASAQWRPYGLANGENIWISVPDDMTGYLEQVLFGLHDIDAASCRHLPSAIGNGVATEALAALVGDLLEGLTAQTGLPLPAAAVPATLWRRGSGAVLCEVILSYRTLCYLLPAEVLPRAGLPGQSNTPGPVTALHQALAHLPVKLHAEIGQAELSLGHLATLAVGDVLTLPARVDHALQVVGPGDAAICHAHLGMHDGHTAVELTKFAH